MTPERRREIEAWADSLRRNSCSFLCIKDCLAEIDRLNDFIKGLANTINALANDETPIAVVAPPGKVVLKYGPTWDTTPTAAIIAAQENVE